jgi:hypothetical protein
MLEVIYINSEYDGLIAIWTKKLTEVNRSDKDDLRLGKYLKSLKNKGITFAQDSEKYFCSNIQKYCIIKNKYPFRLNMKRFINYSLISKKRLSNADVKDIILCEKKGLFKASSVVFIFQDGSSYKDINIYEIIINENL